MALFFMEKMCGGGDAAATERGGYAEDTVAAWTPPLQIRGGYAEDGVAAWTPPLQIQGGYAEDGVAAWTPPLQN